MRHTNCLFAALSILMVATLAPTPVAAEVSVSNLFTDHMVLQRDVPVVVWGKAAAAEQVSIVLADKTETTKADNDGRWQVKLPPLKVGSGPHKLVIEASNRIEINDILIGEVWVCSGQSNMAFAVSSANDPDLESLSANFPQIRIISVPQIGSQTPLDNFQGKWETVTPETVMSFSAVGYFFGRQLHQTLNVPIGLIDTAWGGSACEAWVPREVLEEAGEYQELLAKWDDAAKAYDPAAVAQRYERQLTAWKLAMA